MGCLSSKIMIYDSDISETNSKEIINKLYETNATINTIAKPTVDSTTGSSIAKTKTINSSPSSIQHSSRNKTAQIEAFNLSSHDSNSASTTTPVQPISARVDSIANSSNGETDNNFITADDSYRKMVTLLKQSRNYSDRAPPFIPLGAILESKESRPGSMTVSPLTSDAK